MKLKQLRSRVTGQQRLFGLFCCSYSTQAVEAIAYSGYDFLIFDTEHSPGSLTTLHNQLLAISATDTVAVVRVGGLDAGQIKQCLDLGAHAIMVPNVDTAAQAQVAVSYCRYAPAGKRGVGGSVRVSRYGRDKVSGDLRLVEVVLMVQAESRLALQNLTQISEVEGVDVVFFGPNDLAADMGLLGQPGHPDVVAAVIQGIRQVRAAGKTAAVLANESACGPYLSAGASIIALGSEIGILVSGADSLQQRVRVQHGEAQS